MTTDSWGVTPTNTFRFSAHGREFGILISVGGFMAEFRIVLLELVNGAWTSLGNAYSKASVPWDDGITRAGGLRPFAEQMVDKLNTLLATNAFPGSNTNAAPTDWNSFAAWFIARLSASATDSGVVIRLSE